jgi:indole-3-glycerol phosphate synthase/phosphoribosylanthranilate isomerase
LLDCQVGEAKGGTGQAFNWQMLEEIERKDKLILAGGINPDNVTQAIQTGCAVIDVNSGVETAPGEKCAEKLSALFSVCRQY